jgi:phenylacetate-CoA ligase
MSGSMKLTGSDDSGNRPATVPRDRTRECSGSVEQRLLAAFRHAVGTSPAYRTLLQEAGVAFDDVTTVEAFSCLAPVLTKDTVFGRFPIDQLGLTGTVSEIAEVLTSSGRGGRFSFGLSTRAQAAAAGRFLDDAFEAAYEVRSRSTLAINCLPMGVGFSSDAMTIANTGVRPDRVVGVVQTWGQYYDQVLLVTDPLFLKHLTDFASDTGFDWHRYRMNVCIAEEIFGEHFRSYVTARLGTDLWRPGQGRFMSSFGVGELGLYLGYETQTTITLRRAAHADAGTARELLGFTPGSGEPLPMLFAFNPQRTFIEVVDPDAAGYGRMTISMLDSERTVPLLRYQAGDIAALLDPDRVAAVTRRKGIDLRGPLPRELFALRGRQAEALPNGSHVGVYKDALYASPRVAASVTGVARFIAAGGDCTLHVQLRPSIQPTAELEEQLSDSLPAAAKPTRLVFWPFARFPFGMTLDYERRFISYVPGEPAANISA